MWIVLREVDQGDSADFATVPRCQFKASRVDTLVDFGLPAAVARVRARRCMDDENTHAERKRVQS